ncbi:CAP domain-containing protein [Christiangramia fulva]|uniref:CAP domain-containing protein n=1 Tax=Christiangramia fulva TaxID=2126553 RepID=A0A2R3Z7C5_9FLAO|nr:CAP domain-containing protein [Christiangramia fulva]AVR46128.1 CAP domain-containing protein [Christiangramia fulva]
MRKITLTGFMLMMCTILLTSCSKESLQDEVTPYDQVATRKINYDYSEIEVDILEQINVYRKAKGLNELQSINDISIEAEMHDEYMIDQGTPSHDNFAQRASYLMNELGAKTVSENVAYGYRTADAVVNAWLKSAEHRHNIEGNLTHFGISVRQDAEGKNYFTNIFIKK